MRILALLIFFFLVPFLGKAQFAENNLLYVTPSFSVGNFAGVHFNLNYGYKRFRFQFGWSNQRQVPPEEPKKVQRALIGGRYRNFDHLYSRHLLVGYSIPLNESKRSRFEILAGVGSSRFEYFHNYKFLYTYYDIKRGQQHYFSFERSEMDLYGFVLKPHFVFVSLYNYLGMSLGPTMLINSERVAISFEFGISIGLMGPKTETVY